MGNRISTEQEKISIAEKYLLYGTFRKVAEYCEWSKSTVHKVVNEFIKNGEFYDTDSLKKLIEKNKEERAIRGGEATAKKLKKIKK